jgi:signal transduction histidine kinase
MLCPMARRSLLPTERTMLLGVTVGRWAVLVWVVVTVVLQADELRRPWLAVALLGAAAVLTLVLTVLLVRDPIRLVQPGTVALELGLATLLLVGDGLAFEEGHAFGGGQNLAGALPLIAVLAAATALGPWGGLACGVVVALGRTAGALANGVSSFTAERVVSLAATVVFYAWAGGVWGLMVRTLRRVETEVVTVRAREEVARTLHDTVLQTLAVVAQRTDATDPELAALARRTDRELRAWLYERPSVDDATTDLESELRRVAHRAAAPHDLEVTVNVVDDDGARPDRRVVAALGGAVGEAVTNAARHGRARHVVVFAETGEDGHVFVSVRDDGVGFDPAAVAYGEGIRRSVEGRLAEVGGRSEIVSGQGQGTEVRLWA